MLVTSREANCPDADTLAAFIDGSARTRNAEVERHLCECDACRDLLVALLLTGVRAFAGPTIH
jgi:predicted anti-sigma-YlaC factor YlaD